MCVIITGGTDKGFPLQVAELHSGGVAEQSVYTPPSLSLPFSLSLSLSLSLFTFFCLIKHDSVVLDNFLSIVLVNLIIPYRY